jgi:hypothetical protein
MNTEDTTMVESVNNPEAILAMRRICQVARSESAYRTQVRKLQSKRLALSRELDELIRSQRFSEAIPVRNQQTEVTKQIDLLVASFDREANNTQMDIAVDQFNAILEKSNEVAQPL